MSDNRKIMLGRSVSSELASQQFRNGNNAAINGFAASSRTNNADINNFSSALRSEARAYERSGWEQERIYQQEKKNKLLGKK